MKPYFGEPGNCFENAYRFLLLNPEWTLVHGIPLGTSGEAEDLRYGHAWCEGVTPTGLKVVFDPSVPKKEKISVIIVPLYYDVGSIEYTVRYTLTEAQCMIKKHEHYGPWDKKIDAVTDEANLKVQIK